MRHYLQSKAMYSHLTPLSTWTLGLGHRPQWPGDKRQDKIYRRTSAPKKTGYNGKEGQTKTKRGRGSRGNKTPKYTFLIFLSKSTERTYHLLIPILIYANSNEP